MKSFPSTLNRGGVNLQSNNVSASTRSALASLVSTASNTNIDTEGLLYNVKQSPTELLAYALPLSISSPANNQNTTIGHGSTAIIANSKTNFLVHFDNPFKQPAAVLNNLNRYKYFYQVATQVDNDQYVKYKDHNNDTNVLSHVVLSQAATPSLFNPINSISVQGIDGNTPLIDNITSATFIVEDMEVDPSKSSYEFAYAAYWQGLYTTNTRTITRQGNYDASKDFNNNITDCTIKELVELSKQQSSVLGHARYRYADFMYCKDLGKVPNNHMITLRKFAHPVSDNIFKSATKPGTMIESDGDIGRMITFFGTDYNKLEDILKYDYKATWKSLEAKQQENQTNGDNQPGLLTTLLNGGLYNNDYFSKFVGGGTGGNNPFDVVGKYLWSKIPMFGNNYNTGPYSNDPVFYGSMTADNNRVYTPPNTVQKTHIYEGKLESTHSFTLVFKYTMRSYANINPKNAFLDLLANILTVTYRSGQFWGGRRKLIGPPTDNSGYRKTHAMIDRLWDQAGSILSSLANGSISLAQLISDAWQGAKEVVSGALNSAKETVNGIKGNSASSTAQNVLKTIINSKAAGTISTAAKTIIKNQIGRPALYAWDTLLSGAPAGLWHVTIGNPKNPIAAFGDMIITNTTLTHSGPLGIDDFPTELTVSVQLEQCKPRDASDLQRMYTRGQSTIYIDRRNVKLGKTFNLGTANTAAFDEYESGVSGSGSIYNSTVDNDQISSDNMSQVSQRVNTLNKNDAVNNAKTVSSNIASSEWSARDNYGLYTATDYDDVNSNAEADTLFSVANSQRPEQMKGWMNEMA